MNTFTKTALRILLIEDSVGDAILIERAIKRAMPQDYTLRTETTLAASLKCLSEEDFDIALLDRSLPDAEGYDGLHSIQALSPRMPVVFLTAYQDEETAYQAIRQGAQDYIFKDRLDEDVIRRAVRYAVLRKEFEETLVRRANYDLLTGLANRSLFESRLELALARQKRIGGNLSVMFIDVDRFKQVNDTHGHLVGDRLLKEIASGMQKIFRPYDTLARFGGDEFAVLLEGLPKIQDTEIIAQKIVNLFEDGLQVGTIEIDCGISVGIMTCDATQDYNIEDIMRLADKAMYAAKSQRGNSHCTYSIALENAA